MEPLLQKDPEGDWFLPAMQMQGPLVQCIDHVMQNQQSRAFFLAAIKEKLCLPGHSGKDRISYLRQRINELFHAFELNVPQLQAGASEAWFLPLIRTTALPFMEAQITESEPVCLRIDPIRVKALQLELKTAWLSSQSHVSSWQGLGSCLWLRLLAFNQELQNLSTLSGPFADLTFFDLPDGLPDELYSPSLVAFLSRMKGAFLGCRKDLDRFFERLWRLCDPVFNEIFSQACREKQNQYRTRDKNHSGSRHYEWNSPNEDKCLMVALRFMGFRAMPSSEQLRRRYREMALTCHPDLNGGSDEQFKEMISHYSYISRQLRL